MVTDESSSESYLAGASSTDGLVLPTGISKAHVTEHHLSGGYRMTTYHELSSDDSWKRPGKCVQCVQLLNSVESMVLLTKPMAFGVAFSPPSESASAENVDKSRPTFEFEEDYEPGYAPWEVR